MKITIAGCGRVGRAIARQLVKEDHDIIIVDNNQTNIDYIGNSLDVLPVLGDAASAAVLLEAGVDQSDLLIAVTDSDTINLLICIIAKKIGVRKTIARIREPIYSQTINLIKEDMGLSFVVNPERDAAKEILNSLMFKAAGQVETFAQGHNEVITFTVRENNPIASLKIRELSKFLNRKILVCAIKREDQVFIPKADDRIQLNDVVSFVAKRSDAVHFFKKMKYETGRINDLTIIGGDKLAYYLAGMAYANGIRVKILDEDPEVCRELDEQLPGVEIMCGDGTDLDVLEECGVFQSSAVAMTTGSDEKNVLVSMYLTKTHPQIKVYTRIKKSDFEDMLYGINIGNVYNPKYIAADRVITYVRAISESVGNEVQSLCHVLDNKVEVLEFKIDMTTEHLGVKLQDIRFRDHILLASITRNSESFFPGGDDILEPGDTVLVITTDKGITSFSEIFA